jgi:iron complex outermembrane receptor protein
MPGAASGGAGRIAQQDGTGWSTLALRATRRPQSERGHVLDLGAQQDDYRLRTLVSNAADWLGGGPTTRFSEFRGDTGLTSLYAQDTWAFAEGWRATFGARVERWQAANGAIGDATTTAHLAGRTETHVSPKLALARQLTEMWSLEASLGRAVRFPTVAELYQGSIASNVVVNNDPDLRPERSWTSELTGEREVGVGSVRLTAFFEATDDALYSQTNVTVTPSITTIQNVDEIRTRGLEVAYRSPALLADRLELAASLTYARSLIERNDNFPASVGKWQPRVPDWRANAYATYRFGERWSLTAGGRYSGTQYNTLDNSDTNPYAFTGTSPFIVFDLRARYATERWNAAFGIDNAGDEEYWAFHPYTRRSVLAELAVAF